MALDFFFPQHCLGCGKGGELICPSCRNKLPPIAPPICPRCGLPQTNGVLCPTCINKLTLNRMNWQPGIDGIRSPYRFEGVIRESIHQLKYRNLRMMAGRLAELLSDYLDVNPVPGDILVPVPLHPKRLRERGYNQSTLIAGELCKLTGFAVSERELIRVKNNPPQARTTTVEERQENMTDAFACRGNGLRGQRVIVIDDVSTSGATLNACAVVLKAGGAASVWGLTVAREI